MYEMKIRVPYYDIGLDAYMTETGIINEFQNCCTFQCEDIGFGLRWLKERNFGWFVVSWQLHIHRLPFYGEEIVVQTMPYMLKGPFGNRNFVMRDASGEVLVEANSIWIFMNLEKVSPVRVPKEMVEAFGHDDALDIAWPSRKIQMPEGGQEVFRFEVSPMHVDTNSHMNNTYYVEGARGALPKDFSVKEMYVEYRNQAKLGDTVIVKRKTTDKGIYVVLENEEEEAYATVAFS